MHKISSACLYVVFFAGLFTAGAATSQPLDIEQNAHYNIFSFYEDGGSIDFVNVRQSGQVNVVTNVKKNASQVLAVTQDGRVNMVQSVQLSLSPSSQNANVVAVAQANKTSSIGGGRPEYAGTELDGGYLAVFSSPASDIVFFGPKGSVSTIGRSH